MQDLANMFNPADFVEATVIEDIEVIDQTKYKEPNGSSLFTLAIGKTSKRYYMQIAVFDRKGQPTAAKSYKAIDEKLIKAKLKVM